MDSYLHSNKSYLNQINLLEDEIGLRQRMIESLKTKMLENCCPYQIGEKIRINNQYNFADKGKFAYITEVIDLERFDHDTFFSVAVVLADRNGDPGKIRTYVNLPLEKDPSCHDE